MMKSDEDLYACHEIPERDRIRLLLAFPPIYPVVKADHGTLSFGVGRDFHLPPPLRITLTGHIDDGAGLEVFSVPVDGESQRPDGGMFHITWSLNPDRSSQESNEVLACLKPEAMQSTSFVGRPEIKVSNPD